MDILTHVFLPLTAVYVLKPELFTSQWRFWVAGFGLLPDVDKLLGQPGLLHSLVTLLPLVAVIFIVERYISGENTIGFLVAAFLGSHLILDILDGGPVPLLFPIILDSVGLHFPALVSFGRGPVGVMIHGPLATKQIATPGPGSNSYGFLNGFGIASGILFVIIYFGTQQPNQQR